MREARYVLDEALAVEHLPWEADRNDRESRVHDECRAIA